MTGENISIEISDEGITVEMTGYKNGACLKDMAKIEKILRDGGISVDITSQKLKPEGWIQEVEGTKHAVRR